MKLVKIYRNWQDENQTLGNCVVYDELPDKKPLFSSLSLERGWRNNEQGISCIPLGVYRIELEWSDKFQKDLWEIKNVEKRSECKFHAANYWHQLNGCIALGDSLLDINNDGYNDITNSNKTMKSFHRVFGKDKVALLMVTK